MELTDTRIRWRNVATFATTGALLLLMVWAFLHHQRWLTYLGLLGILAIAHAFTRAPSKAPSMPENDSTPERP